MAQIFDSFLSLFTEVNADAGREKTLTGMAAVPHALANLESVKEPKPSQLERFHVFGWLLTDAQNQQVAAKTKAS